MNTRSSAPPEDISPLTLHAHPPRVTRRSLYRERLAWLHTADKPLLVIHAPSGTGKSTLLSQWRQEALMLGHGVAWITLDVVAGAHDFLLLLVDAIRLGCGRPKFGSMLRNASPDEIDIQSGLYAWLNELAHVAQETVLIIDDIEHLPVDLHWMLLCLVQHAPWNLRIALGLCGATALPLADLQAQGVAYVVGQRTLRFRLEETLSLARERFGDQFSTDAVARLHEMTAGWPLGVQILFTYAEQEHDAADALLKFPVREDYVTTLVGNIMLSRLDADDKAFLVRLSGLDFLHPELCQEVSGQTDAVARLARLVQETPLFVDAEGDWVTLHRLVRDALLHHLHELDAQTRLDLYMRAARWLASRGALQEAAWQAHAAGQHILAYDLAEESLYTVVLQGEQENVLRWADVLPAGELQSRPRLRLATAWALALSERHDQAEEIIRGLSGDERLDACLRRDSALVASDAAYYADDLERCEALYQNWQQTLPKQLPIRLQQMANNRRAALELYKGKTALARHLMRQTPSGDSGRGYLYGTRWAAYFTGLSYLCEGQVSLAVEALRPASVRSDTDLGRRHHLSCMLAAVLAAAQCAQGEPESASETLANRLDVLEKVGTPDSIWLAYQAAARIALARRLENRAVDYLDTLFSIGEARALPRLCIASLCEQLRLHAGKYRSTSCLSVFERVALVEARAGESLGGARHALIRVHTRLAQVYMAFSRMDWAGVVTAQQQTLDICNTLNLGLYRPELVTLHAYAAEQLGLPQANALLAEAATLAHSFGHLGALHHPVAALATWLRSHSELVPAERDTVSVPTDSSRFSLVAAAGSVLTPKESDILGLLARNFSNKEIAVALTVGEETVKWHLKNIFGKLQAGTRKHAVRRAQSLGLIALSI